MLILPDRHIPRVRMLLPVPDRQGWRTPSQHISYYPQQAVHRPWLLRGYDRAGRCRWSGRFRQRDEAEFFRALGNHGLLGLDREMWRLPSPCWDPDLGEGLIYEFAISVTNLGRGPPGVNNATYTVGAGGVPAGALIFICAIDRSSGSASNGTVADTATNTYTLIHGVALNGSNANGRLQTFYVWNCSALVNTNTITFTLPSAGAAGMSAVYATGVQTASDPIDSAASASATGSSTTPSVTSGTPGTAGDLFFGAVAANCATAVGFTQDGSWSNSPDTTSGGTATAAAFGGNLVNAGTGTQTYAPTISPTGTWAVAVSAFKASAAAVATPYFPMSQPAFPHLTRKPEMQGY